MAEKYETYQTRVGQTENKNKIKNLKKEIDALKKWKEEVSIFLKVHNFETGFENSE